MATQTLVLKRRGGGEIELIRAQGEVIPTMEREPGEGMRSLALRVYRAFLIEERTGQKWAFLAKNMSIEDARVLEHFIGILGDRSRPGGAATLEMVDEMLGIRDEEYEKLGRIKAEITKRKLLQRRK